MLLLYMNCISMYCAHEAQVQTGKGKETVLKSIGRFFNSKLFKVLIN